MKLSDSPHEECGVFGMYDFAGGKQAALSVRYGLMALQHRGRDSCGIAVSDTGGPKGRVLRVYGTGSVYDSFRQEDLKEMKGDIGVGHVGHRAEGRRIPDNAQPLVLNYLKGTLALAYNGKLINASLLQTELAETGAIFQTGTDSELIAYHIARARVGTASAEEAVSRAMDKLKGAFSLVVMSPRKLIGARDPFGLRPLCIGRREKAYFLASESCALDAVGAEYVRDVEPGEIVTISPRFGIHSDRSHCPRSSRTARCIFEYISFGRPDSVMDHVSVYSARIQAGRFLASDCPAGADLVIGSPWQDCSAALGFSMQSHIPFGKGFFINRDAGSGPDTETSSGTDDPVPFSVSLNPLRPAVEGKRIVLVEDAILDGSGSTRLIRLLKETGAAEVHIRVCSPPLLYSCPFGTDIPDRKKLIAPGKDAETVCRQIGADSLAYLSADHLPELAGGLGICSGCFTGRIPGTPGWKNIPLSSGSRMNGNYSPPEADRKEDVRIPEETMEGRVR